MRECTFMALDSDAVARTWMSDYRKLGLYDSMSVLLCMTRM